MATGENFMRMSRKDEKLEKMLDALHYWRNEWAGMYYSDWAVVDVDWEYFGKVEDKIESLKFDILCYYWNKVRGNKHLIDDFVSRYCL